MKVGANVAGLLLAILLTMFAPIPASSQEGTLSLVRQTPYVPAEGTFEAQLDWTGPITEDLALSVLIHAPIDTQSGLTSTPTSVLNRTVPIPMDQLPRNGTLIQVSIPVRAVSNNSDRILLREPGVYPVTIEVRGAEGTVASMRSNLIRLPNDIAEIDPLPVAFIIGVSAAEDITVGDATGLLILHPELPLTVQLDDGALTQLETDNDLAKTFREALNGRAVLAAPAYNLDPSALAEIDQKNLYGVAQERTRQRVAALNLVPVSDAIPLDTPLTEAGVDLLAKSGIATIVKSRSESSSGLISGGSESIQVLEVDTELTNRMAAGPRSIEETHRLIASLAIRQMRDRTPVLLGGAGTTSLGLPAVTAFLDALQGSGLMDPIGLTDSAPLVAKIPLRAIERPSQNLIPVAGEVEQVRQLQTTYSDFHMSGGLHPQTAENNLLSSLSLDRNPADRQRALSTARTTIEEALAPIALPEGQAITLAATRSVIPLTIQNNADGPRQVKLKFNSRKVQVLGQENLHTLETGSNTIEIEVEALSLGLSPLDVQVLAPDGVTSLASTSFQIRSTAVPGLGYALTGAALAILFLWWVRTAMNTRKLNASTGDSPDVPRTTSVTS